LPASKKKTPPKKEESAKKKDGPKRMSGELVGKISKDKKDFKVYVLQTKDKKIWAIKASSADKVRKYYGRTVKLKATYYTEGGKNIIESISSVAR
jgi:hypothetical protein